ncbi:MAG: Mov34/MPN/PAD-1 family protein [Chloroflexi bacterium]|nr:Mov34/MPN/PAD-1 family protein [Chloroflexota bacterium]
MTVWKNVEADARALSLSQFLAGVALLPAIKFVLKTVRHPTVLIAQSSMQDLDRHAKSASEEIGGLLAGAAYSLPYKVTHGYGFLTFITEVIPGGECQSTPVSLKMGTDIWDRAQCHMDNGKLIVGWYHSHPGIGAFFSATDRSTQRAFFNSPYSLGLVIDPIQGVMRCYFGRDSIDTNTTIEVVTASPMISPPGVDKRTSTKGS